MLAMLDHSTLSTEDDNTLMLKYVFTKIKSTFLFGFVFFDISIQLYNISPRTLQSFYKFNMLCSCIHQTVII